MQRPSLRKTHQRTALFLLLTGSSLIQRRTRNVHRFVSSHSPSIEQPLVIENDMLPRFLMICRPCDCAMFLLFFDHRRRHCRWEKRETIFFWEAIENHNTNLPNHFTNIIVDIKKNGHDNTCASSSSSSPLRQVPPLFLFS